MHAPADSLHRQLHWLVSCWLGREYPGDSLQTLAAQRFRYYSVPVLDCRSHLDSYLFVRTYAQVGLPLSRQNGDKIATAHNHLHNCRISPITVPGDDLSVDYVILIRHDDFRHPCSDCDSSSHHTQHCVLNQLPTRFQLKENPCWDRSEGAPWQDDESGL
jgi:hypothetical protein